MKEDSRLRVLGAVIVGAFSVAAHFRRTER